MQIIPTVVEQTHKGERGWDIYSRLLMDRIVFLGQEIDDDIANVIIAQLLFLESEDPEKEVMMYINSPGGSVTAGLAIYDTMQLIACDVGTYCMGQAASMASFLLACGAKGKRMALPHARVMIHQPKHTGQTVETIKRDTERDKFMSPEDAKAYGLIDSVLAR